MRDYQPTIPKLNLLMSAAYIGMPDLHMIRVISHSVNWLIDSGAFTNYATQLKGGKETMPLSSYLALCQRFKDHVWEYIALDVIMDKAKTKSNLAAMFTEGLAPVPVFVGGEAFEEIPGLVAQHERGRLCVSGGVGTRDKYAYNRYQKVYRFSEGKARIHALGFVRWPDIFQLPLSTVDSSSFMSGGRVGACGYYDKRKGIRSIPHQSLGKPKGLEARRFLAKCGMSVSDMQDPKHRKGVSSFMSLSMTNAYVELHCHATRLRPAYFFAVPNIGWFYALVAVVVSKAGRRDGTFDYHKAARTLADFRLRNRGGEANREETLTLALRMLERHTIQSDVEPDEKSTRERPLWKTI